jgi:dipeptidyl aminopeptidase/acylaminoacyl peptidase
VAFRPVSDFLLRERIAAVPHTTRRYACRSALALSPDARVLAFVADLGAGTYSTWTIPVAGGRPSEALAVEGAALRTIAWSPSGDLVGAADRGGTERHQLYVSRSHERVEKLSWSEGEKVQRLLAGNSISPDGRLVAFSSNARERADMDVVVEDLANGVERPLVTGPAWHVVGGWSPDGRSLLVMRVQDNTDQDLFVIDAATGGQRHLTPHEGTQQNVPAGWLADGRALCLTDAGGEHLWLAACDAATGAREPIDRPEWDVELAVSSADGRAQLWSVNVDGLSTLRWRRDGTRGERVLDGVCEDLTISADGSRAAFARASATEPAQLWVLDLARGDARMVFESTVAVPREELAVPELVRIPATEGAIPCYLYRPRGARGRVPAVLYPHGGPEAQSRPQYDHTLATLQCLVARGIAVVVPNIHGSTGYGKSWQEAIHRDWGGIDLRDLRAVSEWLASRPGFDPDRLAVYGGSYGGWAVLTCVTRLPERWRCAVDVFGVANLVTMLENAQPNWRRFLRRWIGDLETQREELYERSPIARIEQVRCPMLILQGSNDPRVPQEESDQVVERLRAMRRTVEYMVFPDEGHGFTKRANAERAYERIVEFLTKELLGAV